jgi:1-deoxy-D-xylulose-5-phosphate synthase
MAVARDLAGGKEHVIAVAGDAAFTNGISLRGAQQHRRADQAADRGAQRQRVVHRPQRGRHRPLLPQASSPTSTTSSLHDSAKRIVERFGGKTAMTVARRAEEAAKSMLWPSILFEEFGLQYFGPIDGHNMPLLVETFKFLKTKTAPCCCTC